MSALELSVAASHPEELERTSFGLDHRLKISHTARNAYVFLTRSNLNNVIFSFFCSTCPSATDPWVTRVPWPVYRKLAPLSMRHVRDSLGLSAVSRARLLAVGALFGAVAAGCTFGIHAALVSQRYQVSFLTALKGDLHDVAGAALTTAVAVYDPTPPRRAALGPEPPPDFGRYQRIEEVLRRPAVVADGAPVELVHSENERIVTSRYEFRYQPFDDDRLHELRRKYRLDEVMTGASELERMTRLRHWVRTRFRRSDYQPFMTNFDALTVLDRNLRDHGRPYAPGSDYDPCQLFPLLLSQVLVATGHQARLVSVGHGLVEVWSNQFKKWFVMDAELDYHVERGGIPLNMLELSEASASGNTSDLTLVSSPRMPGEENPTMPHLRREQITAAEVAGWFPSTFEITDMRNDWMTNWYFRGHPARSESNSLVYAAPTQRVILKREYAQRRRPKTSDARDMYWTLNQSEILALPPSGNVLPLAIRTVTPNFDRFVVTVDDQEVAERTQATFDWPLRPGLNKLSVHSVNKFGVPGVTSSIAVYGGRRVRERGGDGTEDAPKP